MTGYKRYHGHSGTGQRLHDVTPEQFEQLLDLIPEPYASMVFVAVWTDGITKTESRDGDLWGQQPTEDLFSSCTCRTPQHVLQSIVAELSAFGVGRAPKDDMTFVVLQVQV